MARNPAIILGLFITSLLAATGSASAQARPADEVQTPPGNEWSHGSTLSLLGGVAVASETHAALGAALGWEVNRHVEFEGSGTWLAVQHGAQAFAAELKVVTTLTRPNRVVPFIGGGIGMYLATFDTTVAPLPAFYQGRTDSAAGSHVTFTDPSFVFAAGLDVFTGTHWSFRPELSARVVTSGSGTYTVTIAAVHATYHFEPHGIVR